MNMKAIVYLTFVVAGAILALSACTAQDAVDPSEPAAGKAENPCNPCGGKAENPCNPCGGEAENPCNPCGGKAENPCNPCGGKAENPCNPCAGKAAKMPAMNPCHNKHGTVFYVADPMKRNTVTFTSEAPLEDIVGTTSEISGYVVYDPERPEQGIRASFSVPTASLNTGIPLRNEHLSSAAWLNAETYPEISLVVNDVVRVEKIKETSDFHTYTMVVVGEFSLHGKTQTLEIPVRLTFMRESEKTRTKMPGDLMAGRASFEVALASFGIEGPPGQDLIGTKVGDTVSVEVRFTSSTAMPAAANPCNPCNPCGGKAGNPCNPCGGKK